MLQPRAVLLLVTMALALSSSVAASAAPEHAAPQGPHWKPKLGSTCDPGQYRAVSANKLAMYGRDVLPRGYVCRRPDGSHGRSRWGILLADGSVRF